MTRCNCPYCCHMSPEESRRYHASEATRIAGELSGLGAQFAEGGIVRTILGERILQERERAHGKNA